MFQPVPYVDLPYISSTMGHSCCVYRMYYLRPRLWLQVVTITSSCPESGISRRKYMCHVELPRCVDTGMHLVPAL